MEYEIIIATIILYVCARKFRITDIEFMVIVLIIIIIFLKLKYKEFFVETPQDETVTWYQKVASLAELPEYVKGKITDSMNGLIKDAQSGESNDHENKEVLSVENMRDDSDIKDDSQDEMNRRFGLLSREYMSIDAALDKLKQKLPEEYKKILPQE